jgi:hypothetical protein
MDGRPAAPRTRARRRLRRVRRADRSRGAAAATDVAGLFPRPARDVRRSHQRRRGSRDRSRPVSRQGGRRPNVVAAWIAARMDEAGHPTARPALSSGSRSPAETSDVASKAGAPEVRSRVRRCGASADARQGRQFPVAEALVGGDVSGGDADEVVGSPKSRSAWRTSGTSARPLEFRDRRRVLPFHCHVHRDLEAKTDRRGIETARYGRQPPMDDGTRLLSGRERGSRRELPRSPGRR